MTKTAKQAAKIIEALRAELAAAVATKAMASDAGDEDAFYAAADRVRAIELEIAATESRPARRSSCAISAELVAQNIDWPGPAACGHGRITTWRNATARARPASRRGIRHPLPTVLLRRL